MNPAAFVAIQIEASNESTERMQVPVQTSTLNKRMKQQRDRQRKRNVQAARNPGCRGSSGYLSLGAI